MSLEIATYLNGLVPGNPLDTDPAQQGAAHVRLLKTALLNTFPGVTGPWNISYPVTLATLQVNGAALIGNGLQVYGTGLGVLAGGITANYDTGVGLSLQGTSLTGGYGMIVNAHNVAGPLIAFQYNGSALGNISTNGGVTAYNTISDYRLKTVLGTADAGPLLDAVPVHEAVMAHGHPRPMFLAHELQAAIPDAVKGLKDAVDAEGAPVFQVVDHPMLVPILWAAVRDLRARVSALEASR
jgi:hypothetical protein